MKAIKREPVIISSDPIGENKIVKKRATKLRGALFQIGEGDSNVTIPEIINENHPIIINHTATDSSPISLGNIEFSFQSRKKDELLFKGENQEELSFKPRGKKVELCLKIGIEELEKNFQFKFIHQGKLELNSDNTLVLTSEDRIVYFLSGFTLISEFGTSLDYQLNLQDTAKNESWLSVKIIEDTIEDQQVSLSFTISTPSLDPIVNMICKNMAGTTIPLTGQNTYVVGRYVDTSRVSKSNANQVSIIISPEAIKDQVNIDNLTNFNLTLRLYYLTPVVSAYAKKRTGLAVSITHVEGFRTIIPTEEGELLIDLTSMLRYCIAYNRWQDIAVNIKSANPWYYGMSGGSQSGISNVHTTNDYAEICSLSYGEVSKRPKLIFSYTDIGHLEKSTPFTEIENGRSGTAGINLFSKEYTFTHPDLTINSGNLSVGLFHFYSSLFSRTIRGTNNSLGWGVGWKTNLHQWLYKYKYAADADELKVVYTDGLGSDHIFLERWYYEKNGQKICIKRSEVYINTLGELAYLDPTGKEYLVTYKVKSDDGLTLTTSAGMFGYRDKTKFKSINRKYFDEHNNEIAMQGADLNLKLYSTPGPTSTPGFANAAELSWLNDNGLAITSPDFRNDFADNLWKYSFDISSALYYPTYVNSPLLYDGTDYFSKFAKAKHELQIVNQYKNSSVNLLTVKDKLESTKIKVEKSAVFDTTLTDYYETEEILQLKNQVEQYDNAIVEAKENAKNISSSLESAINGLEELKKSKARIHVSINQQKISYDPDNVNSDAFKMACYSLQGNLDQIELQIKSADGQIVSTKTSLARALRTVDEYELIRDNLQAKLAGLIKKQKEAPNDFITDEEGNILGFDYYGRLVLIADKYEKAIRIKFKEDKDLFEEIQTENGIIKFNYDSNELLKEIVDVNGKTICFSYTNPKFLSTIKYDDISAHNSFFAYQNDLLSKVIDPAGFNLTISCSTNSLFVVQSTTTKKINNDGLVRFAEQQTKKIIDLSLIKSGLNTTLTNNINNDVATYSFDELGRPLNVISSRGADSEYNYAKYNDHGDVLIESTFSSRHILRKFIENGTSTGLSRTVLFSDTDDVSDNIWRGNLLNTDTLVYYFEFQSDSGQASFMATITITNRDGSSNIKQISITNQTKVLLLPIICNKDNIIQAKIETTSVSQVKSFGIATGDGIFSAYDDDNLIEERQGLNTTLYLDFNHKKPTKIKTIDRYNNTKVSVLSYNDKGQLTYSEDQDGNIEERFYSSKGELLESVTYNKESATDKTINKYEYDEDGNVTELNGLLPNKEGKINPTKKQYYPGTKKVNYQTAPNGLVTSYGFDFYNGSLLSKSAEVDGIANTTNYHYQFNFLTSVSHQEFDIHYEFDGQGRKTSVDVACNNIVKFEYDDNFIVDGFLGSKVITKYFDHGTLDNAVTVISDIYGKTKSVADTAGTSIAYNYDSFDRLTSTISNNESTHFEYDKRGNIKYSDIVYNDFGKVDFNYTYTIKDQVEESITTISDTAELYKYKTKFIYDPLDRLIQVHNYFNVNNLKSDDKLTDEYDFSNRLIKERIHIKDDDEPSEKHQLLANEYLYLKSENQATNLIKKNVTTLLDDTQDVTTYNYDEMGNITRIKNSDNDITYEYDKLSRLTRENNRKLEYSQIFEYDESGNILRSEKYAYTKGELLTLISDNVYSYNQGNYQDQLVDFNGEEIIYDGLGRPTTYRNKTLVWSPRSTLLNYDDYQYQYNEQGIRIKKVVGDTTHKYFVNGTKILIEELNTNSVKKYLKYKYFCDKLYGFNYNEVDYYYLRNTQGDITSIINRNGIEVARYTYDAWGNHVVNNLTEDNIGDINPFRYRGYYFDQETGLYYLNARYYDPETGRFISQDNISYLEPEMINGLNLYAYCGNNPVMNVDRNGTSWWKDFWGGVKDFFDNPITQAVIGGLIIVGLGIATILTLGAAAPITGLAASMVVGAFWGAVASATFGAISGGIQFSDGKIGWSWSGAANGFMWGAITGGIAGAAGAWLGNISFMKAAVENGSKFARAINFGFQVTSNSALSASVTTIQGLITNNFSWTDVAFSAAFGALGGALGNWLSGTKWEKGIRGFMIGFGLTGLESVTAFLYYLYGDKE